jgi:hypothetical protein
MLDIEDVVSRIPEGMALLDAYDPDWVSKIDLNILDMYDYNHCILGQLFGDYRTGRDALDIASGDGKWYGFDQETGYSKNWAILDKAWIAEIKARTE